jgi:hypothetical protein
MSREATTSRSSGEQVLLVAISNTTYYESLVITNPVVRERAVDEQGLVHAPMAPGIGFEAHWGDTAPWESGPLVE